MEEKEKKLEHFAHEYKEILCNDIEERVHKNVQAHKDKKII